jgi:hypothetical protein
VFSLYVRVRALCQFPVRSGNAEILDRGYEKLEYKPQALGADIVREQDS